MKNFKKLSILLLSVVMVFSCFAVLSLAQEDEEAAKIAAVESLLEYYDDEGIYICDPFDGEENDAALGINSDSQGEYAVVDGKTVFAATLDGKNVLYSADVGLSTSYKSLALVYTFRADAEELNEDKGYLAIEFSGASTSLPNTEGQVVFVLDYNEEKAFFAVMDKDTVVSSCEVPGFVPQNGVWYTVSMVYNKSTNSFAGEIAAEGGNAFEFSYKLVGVNNLAMITLRSRNVGNEGVSVMWDTLEIYEGSFIRSNFAGQRQKYLDEKLLAYMQEYADASEGLKGAIVSTVDALFDLGYAPTPGSETETYLAQEFDKQMVWFYWDRFAERVSAFDKKLKYKLRYNALVDAKPIEDAFPEKPDGYPQQMYDEIVAAYTAEVEALTEIAEYSEALLEAVTEDTASMDYQQLLAWIIDFEAKRENLLRADGSYDDTYDGIFVALELYQEAVDRLFNLKSLALEYINAVDAMNKNHPTDFGVKYDAFLRARTIAADPQFVYIASSYNASFCFVDESTVLYDGREFPISSYSEDGKTAYVTINSLPYTVTIANHQLTLVGEGLTIVFDPADDLNSGLAFEGNWKSAKSLAQASADFDNRDDFILAGERACKDFISAIDAALVSKGYVGRVEKRDSVKAAYDAQRVIFEEGGAYFGFEGLAEKIAAFDAFCAQIDEDVANADAYIALVIGLKTLDPIKNYNEIKDIVINATPYYDLLELSGNMSDYENDIASIREVDSYFTAHKRNVLITEDNAKKFREQVELAAQTVDLTERLGYLRAAQKLSALLFDGMDGMNEVFEAFEAEKDEYLADASAMNEVAKTEGMKLVQIAFANLKTVTTQKVAFIIKKVYEL